MIVRDVATSRIATIGAEATIEQAASKMRARDVGLLPVLEGGRITGVVSDRDIVVRTVAASLDPSSVTVREVMSAGPVSCRSEDTIEDAAKLMESNKVRRLLVSNSRGQTVAILSLGDLAVRGGDSQLTGEVLAAVCNDLVSVHGG